MGTLKKLINLHTLVTVKTGLIYRYVCTLNLGLKNKNYQMRVKKHCLNAKVHPNIAILKNKLARAQSTECKILSK